MPTRPTPPANFYDNVELDRADDRRADQNWIIQQLTAETTRYLPVWKNTSFVGNEENEGEMPGPEYLDAAQVQTLQVQPQDAIFLGLLRGEAYFAVDLSHLEEPDHLPALAGRGHFTDLRNVGPLMERHEGALLAYARGMVYWAQRHAFCGVCGHPTLPSRAGHVRACSNEACGTPHFPRTDPAVIMLIHDGGERCVLGRQPVWPPGMHSTLAGFVEPGESLEMAVAREVYEEVGLELTDITYQHSQPWPFPSSLMVGFHARAKGEALKVHRHFLGKETQLFQRPAHILIVRMPLDICVKLRNGEGAVGNVAFQLGDVHAIGRKAA